MGKSSYFPMGAGSQGAPQFRDNNTHFAPVEPVLTSGQQGYAPAYWHQPQPQPHPAYTAQTSYPSQPPYQPHPSYNAKPTYPPQPVYAAQAPYPGPAQYGSDVDARRGTQTGHVLHGLGAVLSVALIFGAGGWVWQLMQRDVAGVPVVRALEGPLRVAPENPGGRQASHQGLSVNELAAAQDEAPRDTIVLAPAPLDLAAEDRTPARTLDEQPQHSAEFEEQPIPVALQQEFIEPMASAGTGLGFTSPTRRAVSASPRPPARETGQLDQSRMAALAAPPSAAFGSGVADDLASSVASSVAMGLSGVRELDVDPATIGPGTRLVQLGAYDDVATARAAWDQLASRFNPLLDDRGRVIEAAHSGGSVFYRLRAHGFSDERDARRFCAALVDQQIDCIPVLIR